MEHLHEPTITLDGRFKCRTCGQVLEQATEEIRVSSKRTAKRILDELAVAGNYYASSYERGFIVFSRTKDGVTEEITGEHINERDYRIIKRFLSKEVADEIGRR